jgi:Ca2+-binding EF-hand superfamily protein
MSSLYLNSHLLIKLVAFQVYDVNGDGFIDNQDLCTIVKLMVGSNFSHDQVQTIVDQTILDADTLDMDGRISFDEFKRAMFAADLESILTISV